MEGLLLGSRELLCSFGRISGTLIRYSSLSELAGRGNPRTVEYRGNPFSGGVSSFYRLARRGFFRGARHVTSTSRHSGADTSSRPLTGTGAQHATLLPPDRGATSHVVATYQGTMPSLRLSVGKFSPSPIQPVVPIPSERFFFPHRFTDFITRTLDTSTSRHLIRLRSGPSGVTGFMVSLLDLMRQTWGC
jgi:hypothetical protein